MMTKFSKLIEPKLQIPEERKRFTNRQLLAIIIPIIIEQFLIQLVGLADTLMISYAGEEAISGVALVDQVNIIFVYIFTAVAAGGAVVAGQYIGSKNREMACRAASQLMLMITLIAVGCTALTFFGGDAIISGLFRSAEPGVKAAGLLYLRITAFSYPFLAVYNASAALFRSMGRTRTIMYVSLLMNSINVIGNAIGIFALHAGVAGVAYPTLISRMAAAVVMASLALNRNLPVHLRLRDIIHWEGSMMRRIFRIALPGGIENGMFQFSKVVLTGVVSTFGTTQIAAYGVAQSFWAMSALFSLSMGPAFMTVVAQYMGAGDPEGADYYMKKILRITYVGTAIWSSAFLLLTPFVLSFYSLTDAAAHLVIIIIVLHNVVNATVSPSAFSLSNGLRAAGDVRYVLAASIISTIGVRVVLAFLFCLVFRWGVIGLTLAMICDWYIRAVLIVTRWRRGKWKTLKVI